MGKVTKSKLKVKTVSSREEGFLDTSDLHKAIRALVPKAPPGAKISIWVDVPEDGNYGGKPLPIDDTNTVQFMVVWDEEESR